MSIIGGSQLPSTKNSLSKCTAQNNLHEMHALFVTEFWKITHIVAREIIRIFMFSGLLIRAGHSFKKYFNNILVI